jgi:hypothetical protein
MVKKYSAISEGSAEQKIRFLIKELMNSFPPLSFWHGRKVKLKLIQKE